MGRIESPADATLSAGQLAALEALLVGRTVTEAAVAAQVDRTTVHRWLREDFVFQAQLNQERRQLRRQMSARLTHLAERAVAAVEQALEDPNPTIGLALLKGLGLLTGSPPPIESDDAAELAGEAQRRELFATGMAQLRAKAK